MINLDGYLIGALGAYQQQQQHNPYCYGIGASQQQVNALLGMASPLFDGQMSAVTVSANDLNKRSREERMQNYLSYSYLGQQQAQQAVQLIEVPRGTLAGVGWCESVGTLAAGVPDALRRLRWWWFVNVEAGSRYCKRVRVGLARRRSLPLHLYIS